MSDPITVEATGKESSSRTTARMNASGQLGLKLSQHKMMPVGEPWFEPHVARPGRFYFVARIKAVPR